MLWLRSRPRRATALVIAGVLLASLAVVPTWCAVSGLWW
jgi:hypothetical protein